MWLGNPYRHTVLKCSMKLYLKVICGVYVILAFLKVLLLLKTALKMAPGTPPKDRLLTIVTPKTSPAHTHTCKQEKKLRNNTTIHKNSKQN